MASVGMRTACFPQLSLKAPAIELTRPNNPVPQALVFAVGYNHSLAGFRTFQLLMFSVEAS